MRVYLVSAMNSPMRSLYGHAAVRARPTSCLTGLETGTALAEEVRSSLDDARN
jgi:hypothetical protein